MAAAFSGSFSGTDGPIHPPNLSAISSTMGTAGSPMGSLFGSMHPALVRGRGREEGGGRGRGREEGGEGGKKGEGGGDDQM